MWSCGTYSKGLLKKLKAPGRVRAAAGLNFNCPDDQDMDNNSLVQRINLINNYIHIKVGNLSKYCLIDSGSDINVIDEHIVDKLNCKKYMSDKQTITAVNNEQMEISNVVYIPITIGDKTFSV